MASTTPPVAELVKGYLKGLGFASADPQLFLLAGQYRSPHGGKCPFVFGSAPQWAGILRSGMLRFRA